MKDKVPQWGHKIKALASALFIIGTIATLGQINLIDPRAAAASCENLEVAKVTAIGYEGSNVPAKTIDNSLKTRWSHHGMGSWITADLGEQRQSAVSPLHGTKAISG